MADEQPITPPPALSGEEGQAFNPAPTQDALLQYIVWLVNRGNVSDLSITLNVDGLLVTGIMISVTQYVTALSEQFVARATPEARARAGQLFDFTFGRPEGPHDGDSPADPPRFIHLREARVIDPGTGAATPSNQGVLWRCRIAAVNGFLPGALGWSAVGGVMMFSPPS